MDEGGENAPVAEIMSERERQKVTAREILSLLREKYANTREWIVASEVQRKTGWSDRRYDFVAMNCFESTGQKIEVVEIKVSKSDLRHELEEAEKHTVIFDEIDFYSLAAPMEIIDKRIIPPKWGIYGVKDGKLVTVRKPLHLHDEYKTTISRTFAASFMRASIAQNLEKSLLYDEKQKSYKEGFEKGRKSCGFASGEREDYERLRERDCIVRDRLYKLGMLGLVIGDGEEYERMREELKRAKEIVDNLNTVALTWPLKQIETCLSEMKEAVSEIERLRVGGGENGGCPP